MKGALQNNLRTVRALSIKDECIPQYLVVPVYISTFLRKTRNHLLTSGLKEKLENRLGASLNIVRNLSFIMTFY